jgi:hypothetical protein
MVLQPCQTREAVLMEVQQQAHGYISLCQRDHRLSKAQHNYSMVKLVVLKLDDKGRIAQFVEDKTETEKLTWVEVNLEPGVYVVCVCLEEH